MTARILMMRLISNQRGATAVEYGLIVSLLVIAMVGAFNNFANATIGTWNTVSNETQAAIEKGKN